MPRAELQRLHHPEHFVNGAPDWQIVDLYVPHSALQSVSHQPACLLMLPSVYYPQTHAAWDLTDHNMVAASYYTQARWASLSKFTSKLFLCTGW